VIVGHEVITVLYSFPHKIGAARICTAAWQHVAALSTAGADVLVFPGAVAKALPDRVRVRPTLARGRFRIPYRALGGLRTLALHDHIVARRLPKLVGEIDIVHTWPSGALETLRTANQLGIPTVLERPNAHTRYAYEVVRLEGERVGVSLPADHEHAYNDSALRREEAEYRLADRLLCPSAFVKQSFLDEGFAPEKLAPHAYGYDETVFFSDSRPSNGTGPLKMLFVGANVLRKGLHYALEAWLRSPAHRTGTFSILGTFPPGYREKLSSMLEHPSVHVLGYRRDYPELLRSADILVLPTVEEGSPLVCVDALASGCVPVVSDVCAGVCRHMENGLVHPVGDVEMLTEHLTMLDENRDLLGRLREGALRTAPEYTWTATGARLLDVYRDVIASSSPKRRKLVNEVGAPS
jgi:glycosyltransferase involved in cell wall biosynthesis